jgi:hypothetical protein
MLILKHNLVRTKGANIEGNGSHMTLTSYQPEVLKVYNSFIDSMCWNKE